MVDFPARLMTPEGWYDLEMLDMDLPYAYYVFFTVFSLINQNTSSIPDLEFRVSPSTSILMIYDYCPNNAKVISYSSLTAFISPDPRIITIVDIPRHPKIVWDIFPSFLFILGDTIYWTFRPAQHVQARPNTDSTTSYLIIDIILYIYTKHMITYIIYTYLHMYI